MQERRGEAVKRRTFITGAAGAVALGASKQAEALPTFRKLPSVPREDGRLSLVSGAVAPPGVRSAARLTSRCSACGLCISSCPGKALRAAGISSYGLAGMMMPRLDFANGFCSPDCHKCAEVCPAEAIEKTPSPKERARLRVGIAEWRHWECITEKGSSCGLCAGRCPNKAIKMVKGDGEEFAHPVADPELCVGCGKCEYYCPAKPKAIVVKGLAVQDFAFGADTLVAYFADGAESTSQERGVKPLLDAVADEALAAKFAGARCYDRIVGRAAAFLYAKLRVRYVFAPVMSKGARKILTSHGFESRRLTETEFIRNRAGDGMCPMDTAVKGLADSAVDEAISAIKSAMP